MRVTAEILRALSLLSDQRTAAPSPTSRNDEAMAIAAGDAFYSHANARAIINGIAAEHASVIKAMLTGKKIFN